MDIDSFLTDGFDLSGAERIETGDDFIDNSVLPFLVNQKAWDNYTDDIIYDADKRMRAWMGEMCQNKEWVKDHRKRRYQYKQLFRILYGRDYDTKKDAGATYKLKRVFSYYSSAIKTTSKNDEGQWRNKPGYVLSPKRYKDNPPYSLRLRFEELVSQGIMPSSANMRVPKDNLSTGHARNPQTEARMQQRKQQRRERFNEYQRARNSRLNSGAED